MAKWRRYFLEWAKAQLRIIAKRREVSVARIAPGLRDAKYVVFMVIRNEAARMPFFLQYYRRLGFEHFVVIYNSSTDNLHALLLPELDVSLFLARGEYTKSRYGNDWINGVLQRYGAGKWILYVDVDEFLVYPHGDRCDIIALTDELARRGRPSLPGMMVDMYSDRPIADNICAVGQDPASACPLFDGAGYIRKPDAGTETLWIKGGVRGRVFFRDDVWAGPALNKTSLVFWKKHFLFLKSAHQLWPFYLNNGPAQEPGTITGALLHFKFLSDWTVRRENTPEFDAGSHQDETLAGPENVQYSGWTSLETSGLIQMGGWPGN